MRVRTQLAWPLRILFVALFLGIFGGMWWWGFDFGQILGGFNRRELDAQIATLSADTAAAQREAVALRTRNMELESDIAMMRGLQDSLQRQQDKALEENARLKEELLFFQEFLTDGSKAPGIGIQRLDIDTGNGDIARYSIFVTRTSGAKTDFDGQLMLQAELVPTEDAPEGMKPLTVVLPDGRPGSAAPMKLRFKYYQRLDGTFAIPPGYQLRALTARAYETGAAAPKASRTLTFP